MTGKKITTRSPMSPLDRSRIAPTIVTFIYAAGVVATAVVEDVTTQLVAAWRTGRRGRAATARTLTLPSLA
jgi:hypothetical protein